MTAPAFQPGDEVRWRNPIGPAQHGVVLRDDGRDTVRVRLLAPGGRLRSRSVLRNMLEPLSRPAISPPPLTRSPDYEQPVGVVQPKPERWEDARYLAWIRTLPCAWCGTEARPREAHHWPTKARGGHDYQTVPLCSACHAHWHSHLTLGRMTRADAEAWILALENRLMARYLQHRRRS